MQFSNDERLKDKRMKNLSLHPLKPERDSQLISYKTAHTILGIKFDRKFTFKPHVKDLINSIMAQSCSLRRYGRNGIKTKTFLYKVFLQSKLAYSYPIYPQLDFNTKVDFQKCQNKVLYSFILSHIPWDERPNAMQAHVLTKLHCLTQICYERYQNFYKKLKDYLPHFYKYFYKLANAHRYQARNSKEKTASIQFALAGRPQFIYSDKYTI